MLAQFPTLKQLKKDGVWIPATKRRGPTCRRVIARRGRLQHDWVIHPPTGRYVCQQCGRRSPTTHTRATCRADHRAAIGLYQRAHKSHAFHLMAFSTQYGQYLFCASCGAYSRANVRGLAQVCPGPPGAGQPRERILLNLRSGHHPLKKKAWLGRPRPLSEVWDSDRSVCVCVCVCSELCAAAANRWCGFSPCALDPPQAQGGPPLSAPPAPDPEGFPQVGDGEEDFDDPMLGCDDFFGCGPLDL